MALLVQNIGLVPFVSERQTYDTTGRAVSFRKDGVAPIPRKSVHVTFRVFTGTALVSLRGVDASPFVELTANESFDFPISTESLYIKGKAGDCEVSVVAALDPIEEGI